MRPDTILALNAINRAFYAAIAPEWSQSRRHAWPGFARLLERTLARTPNDGRLRVLDVGAGDGRFAAYLSQQPTAAKVDYLGLDASQALVAHARGRGLAANYVFMHGDFVADEVASAIPSGPYELVVLLGVLHHVPSFARRLELLRVLGNRLAPHGVCAFTVWRLDRDPRFERRRLTFAEYNAHAEHPIDLGDLEPGDTLVRWGAGSAPPRYCHFPSELELQELLSASQLRVHARFCADGKTGVLNEYILAGVCP